MKTTTALITGGSSGIGLAVSELLLANGYRVYSISRNPERGPKSDSFIPIKFDLCEINKIPSFSQGFIEKYGVPDFLVNNAGYGSFFEWREFPTEEITNQITLLCTAPILLCREFAPTMENKKKGVILNLSSLATLYPLPFMPMYNAGKSALSSFTQSMMLEYSHYPRFIDFRMGDVQTEFNKSASQQSHFSRSKSSINAWRQIEKQLNNSILPKLAALQIFKSLKRQKHGTYHGGTFFHSVILVFMLRFLSSQLLIRVLRFWYRL